MNNLKTQKNIIFPTVCFFMIIFIGHLLIKSNSSNLESNIDKLSNELVKSHALILERIITRNTSSATILGKYIEIENGDMQNFDEFSNTLYEELKGVTNLQLAPNGIVTKIYPLKGHEKAIGHDILKNDKRKKEALLAKKTTKLTLAGPFTLIQGGVAIIARKPVYLKDKFWGFASGLIMIDDLISVTKLHELEEQSFTYRLKRIHPDTGKMDIFHEIKEFKNNKFFTKEIIVPNGKWLLDIQYQGKYISNSIVFIFYIIVLIIASLLSYFLHIFLNRAQQLKEINKELSIEKERFELAVKGRNHGLFDWELKTDNVYFSTRWKDILGYKRDEIKNSFKEWEERVHPDDITNVMLEVEKYLSGKIDNFDILFRMYHKNGKLLWIEASAQASRDKDGNPQRMVGFCSDVTELVEYRQSLEEKVNNQIKILRDKDQILLEQSRLASMGEMIGNIAHQWRQPLSVISSAASGLKLQQEFNTLTDEAIVKNCNMINKNAQHLSRTIDDFRNFIKNDRKIVKFNLLDILNSFLELIDGSIIRHHLIVIKNIPKDIELEGYPNELIQCFMNLFNNSKDALKQIDEDNRLIFIDAYIKDKKVYISFKDNAGGINEDILPYIFEAYFTTKDQSEGTGLGLSMTYNLIVNGMKGSIDVNNTKFEYNKNEQIGAEFRIALNVKI